MNDRLKLFAITALIAAYLGFWSSWGISAGAAQLAFFVSVVGAMVTTVLALGKDASARARLVPIGGRATRGAGTMKRD